MVLDFCRRIDSPDAMAYVQATRGVGMRGHAYRFAGGTPSLWVWVKPDMLDPDGQKLQGHHDGGYALFPLRHQDDQPAARRHLHPAGGGSGLRRRFCTAATA